MEVLIADDSAVCRRVLETHLTALGHEVVVAQDGEEAWKLLQGDARPSLAVLDWGMPGLDGTEICRRLRQENREPYVYVVLLTGRGGRENLLAGFEAGADDFLTKPVDREELAIRLHVGVRVALLQAGLIGAREALRFQATHDALTHLLNRGSALERLQAELERGRRQGTPLSVALVDIDHFKALNDGHGHATGDEALRAAARAMAGSVRRYDTVARYGGEEFLVILPGCGLEHARAGAERLRQSVETAPVAPGVGNLTCSAGVASAGGEHGWDMADLLRRADAALYQAKRRGRNRVEVAMAELVLAS